jgi:hypothetical protein
MAVIGISGSYGGLNVETLETHVPSLQARARETAPITVSALTRDSEAGSGPDASGAATAH